MKKLKNIIILVTCILSTMWISSCSESFETSGINSAETQLFEKVPTSFSGLDFNNELIENSTFNHILYDVVYQGAGVAVGDINNDGLADIFFSGNMIPDKLYLNKGNMQFEDITNKANIVFDGKWSTGVTMADVNSDGYLDIYVCKYLIDQPEMRENALYINNGDLTFTEQAKAFGIADRGYSTVANFFDYNNDGLLDLYVGNQPPVSRLQKTTQSQIIDYQYTDELYKNNGNNTFTNVTKEAGITNYNFTLAATASDINNDGWMDLYVACDFEEPDVYYQNNGDGTFTNVLNQAMKHISTFSMGVDIADINNDGLMDIYVADMVAADNQRLKSNMSGMNPEKFWALANSGYHYQYMFNALQLNNGNGTFSEIGQLSGVSNTDWSWATLFADYDNDGIKDLLVTNGLPKDIKNNDYRIRRKTLMDSLAADMRAKGIQPQIDALELIKLAPSEKLNNYIFHNNGDLTFTDRSEEWGLGEKTFSHGAAYADFDNDGDLDLVISNMNDNASLFKNTASDKKINNYLRLKVQGQGSNKNSIGAKAWIYIGDEIQVQEVSPFRGYFSRNEEILHFGIGSNSKVDKLVVLWPDGREIIMNDVSANQLLTINQSKAKQGNMLKELRLKPEPLLKKYDGRNLAVHFIHYENQYDDYREEILLPYRMSRLGPALASGDVNGDGLEDFFIGGPSGQYGVIYYQNDSDTFALASSDPWSVDKFCEDTGALFFDADNDNDQDLYIVSGGNEATNNPSLLQDRLYLNDGSGKFTKTTDALPQMFASGSKVKAVDYDNDGDLDLFVGGRQIPGKYGLTPRSYLLNNQGGKFSDVTTQIAPELGEIGMVTDAIWTDYDNDNDADLIVVGEWMPITVFENDNGSFTNRTVDLQLENTNGWWNNISAADYDGDGDEDYILGNLGLNIKYKASDEQPFRVYVNDFDDNGTHDVYLAYYDNDGVSYPVRGRQCSSQQLPFIKEEFKTYGEFAVAPVENVIGSRMEGGTMKEAKIFESIYLENNGDSGFKIKVLPVQAQTSPIFATTSYDWNKDGNLDVLTIGNFYEREVETTRSDAGIGNILLGDGSGNFQAMNPIKSGLNSNLDARDMKLIFDKNNKPIIVIANNNFYLEFYKS